jgi:uncharacterized iron-regulated protein
MPSFENYYAAQVAWDETMAETASQWFLAAEKAGQRARLLIFAGGGHCHDSAIPRRLARRTGREVLSVRPRTENELDSRRKPGDQLSVPTDQEFDLVLVSPSE